MSQKVPEGWQERRLGDLIHIERESLTADEIGHLKQTFLYSIPAYDDGKMPQLVAGNTVQSSKYIVPSDCVLFSKLNPRIPRVWRVRHNHAERAIGSTEFWPLAAKDRRIDLDFLSKFIGSKLFLDQPSIKPASSTNSHQRVDRTAFLNFMLPVPPLPEQRRIAEILTSVDEAIAATQAVIDQTRTVKQGVLKHLLTKGIGHTRFKQTEIGEIPEGWEVKRFRDVCSLITSGSRGWAQHYSESGALFLRSQNVRCGCLDLTDRQYVRVPAGTEGARTRIVADDLLFTITGNSVGNVASAGDIGEAYVSQHIALARLNDPMMSEMLVAFFSPDGPGNSQVLNAQYGQSKPGLSLENVRNFFIPIPPRSEIKLITDAVRNITMIESQSAAALNEKISLKSALMSDLLTGHKRVPLPHNATAAE